MTEILKIVGHDYRRSDARRKVTGRATYAADITLPGMLHAKVLRSPHAHAKILRMDVSKAEAMPGVHCVLTAAKLKSPDLMPVYGYFIKDQPIVATDRVRYEGDIVAAVAAETESQASAALSAIIVEYEALQDLPTIESALAEDAPELFEQAPIGIVPPYGAGASASLRPRKNVCYEFRYNTGDASVFDGCDHVFEDEFLFSRMHHFHLEPFVSVAQVKDGGIEIWASNQNPFGLRKEIARIFRTPETRIKVNVPFVGGGFGAKNNCKTEPVSVLLSKLTGRPVRFCMTLEEGFLTNTQHAAIIRLKTGVMKDGTLVARDCEVLLDSGAYSDASPLVAEKAGYRAPGPYKWKYANATCQCVMTTTAPAGPFRGFGGTQATWAGESQIDMIARRLGLDPMDIRLKNLLSLHEPYMPGESGIDSDMNEGLTIVANAVNYRGYNKQPGRGVGLAVGFKDGGGVNKPAQARVKITTAGDIFIHCGTVEIGQGAHTAFSAIVAEILGAPMERVTFAPLDTDHTPFDQGTNASSGIAVMGQALEKAARKVKSEVLDFAAQMLGCEAGALELENWTIRKGNETYPLVPLIMREFGGTGIEFTGDGFYKIPLSHDAPLEAPCVFWEIGWAACEVEVDTETGKIIVHKLVVSGDAGRALNKATCRGQDDGAAVMGLGQALFERMVYDGSRLVNGEALEYRVPLAEDLPAHFESILQEQGHGPGPFGSKGMGEGTMLPVPPAIANAIEDAIGVRITELPITPEKILAALEAKGAAGR
jgi:CO/xanthine dehydrogenase Mo-binding subunit